jgi:hypothetical protein
MAIYSAVNCWEIKDTSTWTDGLSGTSAGVTLGCAYADRYTLASDLLANRRVWPGAGGTGAPRVADVNNVRGWGNATLQPGSSEQIFDYEEARMDVTYAPLAGEVPTGAEPYDLVLESLEGEVDGKRLDHNRFLWTDPASPPVNPAYQLTPGESPVKQVNRMKWSREFIGISYLPADMYSLIGKVNNAPFVSTILNFTFGTETLRFNYPYASRSIRTDGATGWNLKLSMSFKEETWNKFWRIEGGTGDGGYEDMYIKNGPIYKNYPLADFGPVLGPT